MIGRKKRAGQALGYDLGSSRRTVGSGRAHPLGGCPAAATGQRREEANRLAAGAQRDHLPHAEWLSMESVAQTVR